MNLKGFCCPNMQTAVTSQFGIKWGTIIGGLTSYYCNVIYDTLKNDQIVYANYKQSVKGIEILGEPILLKGFDIKPLYFAFCPFCGKNLKNDLYKP